MAILKDDDNTFRCSREGLYTAVLIKFSFCDPSVLTELLVSFYMSYGCALWSLDSCVI